MATGGHFGFWLVTNSAAIFARVMGAIFFLILQRAQIKCQTLLCSRWSRDPQIAPNYKEVGKIVDELLSFEEWQPEPPIETMVNGAINRISHHVTYPINWRSQFEAIVSVVSSDNVIPLCKQQCELCELVSKRHGSGQFAR